MVTTLLTFHNMHREKISVKVFFAGWMLLNYQKPVQASSTLGGFQPNLAVDEDIKTYWSAKPEMPENGIRQI